MKMKKILALTLALAMVLSTMSFTVLADVAEPEAITLEESIPAMVLANSTIAATITNEGTGKNETYDDIDDAFAALSTGDTITIAEGVHYLNKSDEWSPRNAEFWLPANVTIIGEEGAIIEREPKFYATGLTVENVFFRGYAYVAMNIHGNATFVNCVMEAPNGIYYSTVSDSVKFVGCTVKGDVYGLHIGEGTGDVIIEGCTIAGWNTFGNNGTVTISDSTFLDSSAYKFLGFYQEAILTNCEFAPGMTVAAQTTDADIKLTDCTVTGGLDISTVLDPDSLEDMTVKSAVAKIGDNKYYSLADAIANATDADGDGVITIEICGEAKIGATFNLNAPCKTLNIVGTTDNAEIYVTANPADNGIVYVANDAIENLNFSNLKLSRPNGEWRGNEGHHNRFFTVWDSDGSTDLITYTNCVFPYGAGNNQYGKTTYEGCTFNNDNYYALWIYGSGSAATVEVTGGTFVADRGIKIYSEGSSATVNTTIKNSTFEIASKPAIVSSIAGNLVVENVDATACEYGLLASEPKDGRTDLTYAAITVDGKEPVYVAKVGTLFCTDIDYAEAEKTDAKPVELPVAKIGEIGYFSFEEALADAVDGDVIDLSGNTHVLTSSNKNVKGKSITIENGKFDLGNTHWAGNSTFDIDNGGYLTLNNVDFVGNGYSSAYGVLYAHGKSTVELNNCDFDLKNEQYSAGGVLKGNGVADSTFIVNGGTFNLENPNRVISNATVAINGVTIDAKVTNNDLVVGTLNNHAFRNLVGRVINSNITADGFETGIKNTDGNLEITGNSVVTLKNSKVADLVLDNGKKVDVATTAIFDYTTSDLGNDTTVSSNPVADINGVQYFTLQDAVDAAKAGETITLSKNIAESITFSKTTSTVALFATTVVPTGVTLDLNGFTLTGNIIVEDGAVANIVNGKIVNNDAAVSAVESTGEVYLENVDIISARHAVRIEGGKTTINSGSYKVGTAGMTTHAVNVSDGGEVVINGGVFEGPAATANSDSGAAVNVQAGSKAIINNGTFTGGKTNTLAGADITVYGGSFDQDPSAYVPLGYNVYTDIYGMFGVEEAATDDEKLTIEFVKADVDTSNVDNLEGEDIYNINVVNGDGINRLNSADLTFLLTPNAVNGGAMTYEILEKENSKISVTKHPENADRYLFNYDTKTDVTTDTATSITIGQVKFTGYGSYDFEIVGNENEVHATTVTDNIVDTYDTTGDAGKGVLDTSAKLDDVVIKVPVRTLTINIAFPNSISGNDAAYQDMKVEVSGNIDGVQKTVKEDLGMLDANNGYSVAFDNLVLNEAYNVTVSGAGYRTARYTVTMTDDKTLNFWNNVKDTDTVIEIGKNSSAAKVTFLAGDIVKDNSINIYDLSAVVSYFGTIDLKTTNATYAKYDLNRDNKIDSKDVAYVLVSWGK